MWLDILILLAKFVLLAFITYWVRYYGAIGGVGGGRLLLLPLISLIFGFNPAIVIATAKISNIGSISAIHEYHKQKLIDYDLFKKVIYASIIGAAIGAIIVAKSDQEIFSKIFGILILIGMLATIYFSRRRINSNNNLLLHFFALITAFTGVIIGFRGPIIRSLFISRGLTDDNALATQKTVSFLCTIVIVSIFIYYDVTEWDGQINWILAVILLIASTLGSRKGAEKVPKIKKEYLKRIFIISIIILIPAMIIKEYYIDIIMFLLNL